MKKMKGFLVQTIKRHNNSIVLNRILTKHQGYEKLFVDEVHFSIK